MVGCDAERWRTRSDDFREALGADADGVEPFGPFVHYPREGNFSCPDPRRIKARSPRDGFAAC